MKEYKLKNGFTVIHEKRQTDSVTLLIMVKTGSINEDKSNYGVSHFTEHMLFEGTKKRPNSLIISNEIESLGTTKVAPDRAGLGIAAKGCTHHLAGDLDCVGGLKDHDHYRAAGDVLQEAVEKRLAFVDGVMAVG